MAGRRGFSHPFSAGRTTVAPGFVGLWQINAEVPQNVTPGTAVPRLISAGGNTSNTVTIAVE